MTSKSSNGESFAFQERAGPDYVELWMSLVREDWGSLVVIPADRDGSSAEVAKTLAEIGQRLSYGSVTAITMSSLEYGSALALADLQQHMKREQVRARMPPPARVDAIPDADVDGAPVPAPQRPPVADPPGSREPQVVDNETSPGEALMVIPPARLVISVPPVLSEPLGLAAAEEADAVVLVVRMRRSRMAELRRTIELVGRERIRGCLLVG